MTERMRVFVAAVLAAGLAWALPPMPEQLDRAAALEKVAAATAADAPNANALTIAQAHYVQYEADGSETSWFDFWCKALTEAGAVELRDLPVWYKEGFSEAEIQVAEVVRLDGTVEPIDIAKNTSTATSNSSNASNIYDDKAKRLVLTVPRLEKGETLHVVLAQHIFRPRIPGTYSDVELFESTEAPLPYASLTILAPKELPLKATALLGEVPGTVTQSKETRADGRVLYRWVARNVPQTFPEENMPEESTQLQRVVVSTFSSWEELSKWYWDLCVPHLKTTPAIEAKVKELTEGKSREEQISALFGFVAQGIRYMGIIAEDTAPGYEPHDVSLTFDNRYGVCRDKGALLVAMYRLAGFEAFPVLINAGSKRDKEVAIPYFNHAIVAIDLGKGDYKLVDPTDDTARAEMPGYLSDCTFLVCRPEGDTLQVTPVPSPEENCLRIATEGELDAAGTLTLSATLDFGGLNDTAYRPLFVKHPIERIRDRFDGILKRILPGAKLDSLTFTPANAKDISQPLQVKLTAQVPGYALPDEAGHTMVTLPFLSRGFGMINFLFDGLDQPTRKYDWVISAPCSARETVKLRGFGTLGEPSLLPEDPIFKSNGASYDVTCKRDAQTGELTLTRAVELTQKTYTPENYQSLRRFYERVRRQEAVRPLFAKQAGQEDDAIVLKRLDFTTLNPDGTRTRRQIKDTRILTFQGKRANGEVKLNYVPAFQKLTLAAAEVRTAQGDLVSVTEKERNTMDVDGAALTPRYPTAKQLVVSLPAIEVGATSHIDWEIHSSDVRPFCETVTFAAPYPTEEQTYTLTLPLERAADLRVAERNFGEANVERSVVTNGTNVAYTWTLRHLGALHSEGNTPPAALFRPTLHLALRDAAAHRVLPGLIDQARAQVKSGSKAARAAAKALAQEANLRDPEAKLRAVQTFLARRIRPLGPAWTSLPFGTLSAPDAVLADGYGNRLDRLLLRQAMLEALGVESELVFASDSSLAEAFAFREALAVREVPRWTRWTTPYLRLADGRLVGDEGEFDEPGASAISTRALMTQAGRILYERPEALRSRSENTLRIVLRENGDATISTETFTWGTAAGALRQAQRDLTPEARRRAIASLADALAPGATPTSEYVVDTAAYPVRARLAVEAKAYATRQGDLLSLPVPLATTLYALRGTTRRNPILQPEVEGTVRTVDLWLPKGAEIVSKPEPYTYALPGGGAVTLTCTTETLPVTGLVRLTYTATYTATPALLDRWFYPALTELDRSLGAPSMGTLVIRLGR